MEKVNITLKDDLKVKLPEKLGFGTTFTNHIFEMNYDAKKGWHNPEIKPLKNMPMHPALFAIHYGQSIFEGLKAFKTDNNRISIFRPRDHFKRLNYSARRLCIPEIDEEFALQVTKQLINIDKDWIPTGPGESLYIRPCIFGADEQLGLNPSQTYKFIIILSSVGAYYLEGFKPVKILIQKDYVRAVVKGTGDCKTSGNYAASLLALKHAQEMNYSQVLWLDGIAQEYIEEVGTMNIFIAFKDEIVTPPLNGSILAGITRKSTLTLLKDMGKNIIERSVKLDEFIDKYNKNEVLEVFGTGTAAIISSVGVLKYNNTEMIINNAEAGPIASTLFEEITSIQKARKEDSHNWLEFIE